MHDAVVPMEPSAFRPWERRQGLKPLAAIERLRATGYMQAKSASSATVSATFAQCSGADSVQVWAFGRATPGRSVPADNVTIQTQLGPDGGPLRLSVRFVQGSPIGSACAWTFDDLSPGEYVALIVRPDGSGGSERFAVQAGMRTTVRIPPPAVELTATVLRNGSPVSGLVVRVSPVRFSRPALVAVTNASGRFRVWLDRPELHEFVLDHVKVHEALVTAGANDVTIELGRVR